MAGTTMPRTTATVQPQPKTVSRRRPDGASALRGGRAVCAGEPDAALYLRGLPEPPTVSSSSAGEHADGGGVRRFGSQQPTE
ncbi:hypothetical protein C5746_35110 [Streptomyces atratus]|uniref:Uncharacterized protein n=1 Tax=Streptomyces atratus TaxID=1893 RepID=A0A2Z5JLH4_STRAR|nr:hypothetical protein C5746_35110 [Streptomyces atratus]